MLNFYSVKAIQPDFVVCAAYKWLMGPYSCALVYAAEKWHNGVPIEQSWSSRYQPSFFSLLFCGVDTSFFTRKDWVHFEALVNYCDAYEPGAHRYDMGEKSQFTQMPILVRALTVIVREWGIASVSASLAALCRTVVDQARRRGWSPVPDHLRAPHYIGIRFPKGLPEVKKDPSTADRRVVIDVLCLLFIGHSCVSCGAQSLCECAWRCTARHSPLVQL